MRGREPLDHELTAEPSLSEEECVGGLPEAGGYFAKVVAAGGGNVAGGTCSQLGDLITEGQVPINWDRGQGSLIPLSDVFMSYIVQWTTY